MEETKDPAANVVTEAGTSFYPALYSYECQIVLAAKSQQPEMYDVLFIHVYLKAIINKRTIIARCFMSSTCCVPSN